MGADLHYTPVRDISKIRAELQAGFDSGKLKSLQYRKFQILQLTYLVKDNVQSLLEALKSDLGRPFAEGEMQDIGSVLTESVNAFHNVEKWAATERPAFELKWAPMRPVIRKEPKGVVLIIGAWNYPIFITLGPLAGALAAGNAVVLKPSEQTPAVSALIAKLVPKYLDNDLVRVVNGGVEETTELLNHTWGHLLYTGNSRVGRIVASAAGKTLTPVTLELGGKCPAFVHSSCDARTAARRILWAKFSNAGQTCLAPDYVLVEKSFQTEFFAALSEAYKEFYPRPEKLSDEFTHIVSKAALTRLKGLLHRTHGTVRLGGGTVEDKNYMEPTIVIDVGLKDSLMSEEIFGPILPVVPIIDVDEGIAYVNAHDHPLALYVFAKSKAYQQKVFDNTQSGACLANDAMLHPAVEGLPFGGIGASGSGAHTGKFTFDTFTHLRPSLDSPNWVDRILGWKYPPYTEASLKGIRRFVHPPIPARATGVHDLPTSSNLKWLIIAVVVGLFGAWQGGLMKHLV